MKSSIKIDLTPVRGGNALEPVIRVKVNSDNSDIRDYSLQTFFQSRGFDSNVLIVKAVGGWSSDFDRGDDYEIYPAKNILLDFDDTTKEVGIKIGQSTKELIEFLDSPKEGYPLNNSKINYTNSGKEVVLYNIQNIWQLATEYGRYLEKNRKV